MAKKLVIMPPSFRRKKSGKPLPAIEMYDGVLYHVLKANMPKEGVDVVVLTEDLELIPGRKEIPYKPPKGEKRWSGFAPMDVSEGIVRKNLQFLEELLEKEDYDEIFVALGRRWRSAIKGIDNLAKEKGIKVTYISGRGLGPYEASLKKWLKSIEGVR